MSKTHLVDNNTVFPDTGSCVATVGNAGDRCAGGIRLRLDTESLVAVLDSVARDRHTGDGCTGRDGTLIACELMYKLERVLRLTMEIP